MMNWFDEAVTEKLHEAGNHVIMVPACNPDAPIDTVDLYDGITGKFIAAGVPEEAARKFAKVWNDLQDSGENTESAKHINLEWLLDGKQGKRYNS